LMASCLPISQIDGFKFLGWCRRGGGGDLIRCVLPSALSPLLRRWLRRHGGAGRMCCPQYTQTVVYAGDRWKMVYPVLGLWMEDDNSDFLPRRHSRVGMLVLEFDRVSEDILSRSDSFNNNGFVYGKLLWGSKKLLISDGAVSSSGDVVTCLPLLWRSLRWCLRRRIGTGFFCIGLSSIFSVLKDRYVLAL
jgi:hypothetical protein